MTSDETIRRAAEVLAALPAVTASTPLDAALVRARALDEAGLLAPAPLTEEFGAQVRGGVRTLPDGYRDVGSHHRYVTEWLPVDGVDRAEGGGRAASHE